MPQAGFEHLTHLNGKRRAERNEWRILVEPKIVLVMLHHATSKASHDWIIVLGYRYSILLSGTILAVNHAHPVGERGASRKIRIIQESVRVS